MDCAAEGDFWRTALSGGAASFTGRPAGAARNGAARARAGRAARGDEQRAFSAARRASAPSRAERHPHRRAADDRRAPRNHEQRSVVQAGGGNGAALRRSSGSRARDARDCRALQPPARAGQADLSGISRAGGRDAVFVFVEAEFRGRAAALSAFAAGGARAADARARSDREAQPGAVFSARVGHRRRSAAARDSGGGARLGGEFDSDVLPGDFARVPAALGALLRALPERAARRLPGH